MFRAVELPALSHVESQVPDGHYPYFVTEDGRVGVALNLPLVDAESPAFDSSFAAVTSLLSRMKPGVTLRVIQRATPANDAEGLHARRQAIAALGWLKNSVTVCLETQRSASIGALDWMRSLLGKETKGLSNGYKQLEEAVDLAILRDLGATPLEEPAIRDLFLSYCGDVIATKTGIDAGTEVIAVLRLVRQGVAALSPDSLSILREGLIAPYNLSVTIRKIRAGRAQYILQRRRGHLASSTDSLAARVYQQTNDIAAETVLAGKSLVEIEWLLVLRRRSEAELRGDLETCQRALALLGDLYVEIQGAAASFAATIPGSDPHHTFLELDDVAPYYLPLFGRGEAPQSGTVAAGALPLHRRDGSLYVFDLWRKGYDGANCIINGRRGKGKSVLANLISSALLNDPAVRLVKVDVGGSYVKECELVGGKQVQFNLSEPSGLNPFALLTQTAFPEDAAVILAGFLSTLILESRETVLSKEMLGAIEKTVLAYAESRPTDPSLPDFLAFTDNVPRRALLERFSPGGVFANVLRDIPGAGPLVGEGANRYVYFNFERLQNAANEDFAQAVMAAVIAATNMEVLRAGDARRGAKHRVVFFADETPFFIQRNGRFFKLTTANFRKFGHATILIAQTTKDFELPKDDGQTDYGILINSPIRFFYQVDDDTEVFGKRFALTDRQVAEIQSLGRSEEYREVFLQDELGGRVLRVAVTSEEYWRVTSSRADNEQLQALMKAVPGLSLEQGLRCLAIKS